MNGDNLLRLQDASSPKNRFFLTCGQGAGIRPRVCAFGFAKAFRFEGASKVAIARKGGCVILRPLGRSSIEKAIQALGKFKNMMSRAHPKKADRRESS
jgi:virulence-associated protein VagC